VPPVLAGEFFTTEPSGKPLGNDSNVSNLSLRAEKGYTSGQVSEFVMGVEEN